MKNIKLYNTVMQVIVQAENDNPELLSYIESHKDQLKGPKSIDRDLIVRTVGPERGILNHEPTSVFDNQVDKLMRWIQNNPAKDNFLLCEKYNNKFYILDGNHRFEALKKMGDIKLSVIYTEDSVINSLMNQPK